MVHGNCRLGWSRCFPMSAAYTPVMCRYTHLHVSVYIYVYYIHKIISYPSQDLPFCVFYILSLYFWLQFWVMFWLTCGGCHIYIYSVLDFRVVVFWWRAQGPPENAKTRKFKKTRCRWMHPKTRKFENPKSTKSKRKPENAKIWKVPKKNKKPKTRKSEKYQK